MKKILIVEDVDINLDLLVQLLEDEYTLVVARDGVAGVTAAAAELPDLVLMDMSLPVMDGWEATRRIKDAEGTRHIPVLGLSAHAMASERSRALEAGCADYLVKPVDEDLLTQKIRALLGDG